MKEFLETAMEQEWRLEVSGYGSVTDDVVLVCFNVYDKTGKKVGFTEQLMKSRT